jgi:hypothetical protein
MHHLDDFLVLIDSFNYIITIYGRKRPIYGRITILEQFEKSPLQDIHLQAVSIFTMAG